MKIKRITQKILSPLLSFAILLGTGQVTGLAAASAQGTGVTVYYCSTGLYTDSGCTQQLDPGQQNTVTRIEVKDGTKAIGVGTFWDWKNLIGISIAGSVTEIQTDAFHGCTGLTNVTIPASVQSIGSFAFYGCTAMQTVTFESGGNQNTVIGSSAFGGCTGLTNAALSASVNDIGVGAFQGCIKLKAVTFGQSSRLGTIEQDAFHGCTGLTNVIIPASAQSIGSFAFYGCAAMRTLTLESGGNQNTVIGNSAFENCTGLTCADFSPSVSDIGVCAFQNCNDLKTVSFGQNSRLGTIGQDAFHGCVGLAGVSIPASVQSIGSHAFYGCTAMQAVTLESGSSSNNTVIGSNAFENCTSLTNAALSASVNDIGICAFQGCTNLEMVSFGQNSRLGTIGQDAFHGCAGLINVTIPASVQSIGSYAFYGCADMRYVTLQGGSTVFGAEAFDEGANHTVIFFVPPASEDHYGKALNPTIVGGTKACFADKVPIVVPVLPFMPAAVDRSTGISVEFNGVVFPSDVTKIALSAAEETQNPAAGSQAAAALSAAGSEAGLNVITPYAYNLKLLDQNGSPAAFLKGRATVRIPIPAELHGTPRVFRYDESSKLLIDMNAKVENGFLTFFADQFGEYVIAGIGDSIVLDTLNYQMPINGRYQIGLRLTGAKAAAVKYYSADGGIAAVAKLENGNYQVTGKNAGATYIMFDVYDDSQKLLTHASVRVDVIPDIKPHGDSARQYGMF